MQLEFIKKTFLNYTELNQEFKSVQVTHCNNLSTFVPNPFFKEENLADYLQYNLKVLENDFIAFDRIESADMVNVYIPFVHINNFFFDKYGAFVFKHSSSVLVENLLAKSANTVTHDFYVHVEKKSFQIIIINKKKLIYYNSFSFNTKEDFIYYILFAAEQLHLNPEEFKLTLIGDIEKESELYTVVYNYVRHVNFLKPKHSNFILLNQN